MLPPMSLWLGGVMDHSRRDAKRMPIDVGSISALTTSLKSLADLAKILVGIRDASVIQEKVIELQQVIMSAQSSALAAQEDQFALVERVRELERQIAEMEDWGAERQRYELQAVHRGAFAYVVKSDVQGTEPPHWLCAACFGNRKKSILQKGGKAPNDPHSRVWKCPSCASEVMVYWSVGPDSPQVAAAEPDPPQPRRCY
jgi:hypothetical protein